MFGFLDDDEKATFELVQTASGVGPKLAQAMLAVLDPDDLRRAVAGDDVKTLTKVPGIGQKVAQRIILELKDRLGAPVSTSPARPDAGGLGVARPGPPRAHRPRLARPRGGPGGGTRWPTRPASSPTSAPCCARRSRP